MKLVAIDKLPVKDMSMHCHTRSKSIIDLCDDFLNMNIDYAQIIIAPGDYKNYMNASESIRKGVKRYAGPVQFRAINNELFLIRKRTKTKKVKPMIAKKT